MELGNLIAGECRECGDDMIVIETRTYPSFHDCKCKGCGREASIPWGISVSVDGDVIATTMPADEREKE